MNLIICYTNLQILIAQRIIELYPNEEFYGLLYTHKNSSKNEYYAKQLKAKCTKLEVIYIEDLQGSKLKSNYKRLLLFFKHCWVPKFDKIFIASIDICDIHLCLHRMSQAEVITYDDGSLNLNPVAFNKILGYSKGSLLYRLLNRFFGVPSFRDLLKRKTKHYTIYKAPNVMGKATFIHLFPIHLFDSKDVSIQNIKRILLGQPFYKFGGFEKEQYAKTTNAVIERFAIDYYYPHPREDFQIDGLIYIDSPYLFEDYLFQEIKKNPNTKFEVYSYCSSVLLNLAELKSKQLSMTAIRPSLMPKELLPTYDSIASLGIKIEDLDC